MCHILFDAWCQKCGWNLEKSRIAGTFPKAKWEMKAICVLGEGKLYCLNQNSCRKNLKDEMIINPNSYIRVLFLLVWQETLWPCFLTLTYLLCLLRYRLPLCFVSLSFIPTLYCLFSEKTFCPMYFITFIKFKGLINLTQVKEDHCKLNMTLI
jgi:hypothetical protein